MQTLVSFFLLAFLFASLGGCGSTLRTVPLDRRTGYFPTTERLDAKEWLIKKKRAVAIYKKLLYLRTPRGRLRGIDVFLKRTLAEIRFFDTIKDSNELSAIVIAKGLQTEIKDLANPLDLHRLGGKIGPFLVADYEVRRTTGLYVFSFRLQDPSDGKYVLHLQKRAYNWSGLDTPLFYPVLNGVIDWLDLGVQSSETTKG